MAPSQQQLFRLGDSEYGRDFLFDIVLGLYTNAQGIFKFGRNSATGTNEVDIWDEGGSYTYATVGEALTISSSDANDAAGDAGARTVEVEGLDGDYLFQSERVALNGVNGVALAKQYIRIYRLRVLTAGASLKNEGKVYVGKGAIAGGKPATVYARITEGMNQTLMTQFTVPANKRGLILQQYMAHGKAAQEGNILLYTRRWDEVFQVKNSLGVFQQLFAYKYSLPLGVAPKTDIVMRADMGVDTEVSAGYDLVLFNNDENIGGEALWQI